MKLPDLARMDAGGLRRLREQIKRELALAELDKTRRDAAAIRDRCRNFATFVQEAWHVLEPANPLKWSWHLQTMCDHLEAISRGTLSPWLIINVPPGSSKSMIVSVMWQAWVWGPFESPAKRFVSSSFEMKNVTRDTRKTRDLILSDWYKALWPEVFDGDGKLSREGETSFANHTFGSREGVAFKSIMGKRGDVVIIDDPHSLDGAESENERTKVIRLFLEGGLNRSNDAMTSAMVIVMQRVHQDDLSGALLSRSLGFVHLMIPMEFEEARRCKTPLPWTDPRAYEGELMDPVRMPAAAIDRQKQAGEYSWNGQYQQRPAPREGGLFKVEKIDVVESCPPGGTTVAGWDFAGSKRKTSPYTVRVKMTRVGGDYYIRHVERRRTDPTELNRMVEETVADDGIDTFQSLPQDPGQAGKAQKWAMSELLAGYRFEITPETGDKETRAEPFAAQVGAGRVHMVKGDWNAAYREELRGFPSATYKDQVDGSSRAFAKLVGRRETEDNAAPEIIDGYVPSRILEDADIDPWGA